MAYEKQTWAKGDVVTAAKLNHVEQGIADSGGLVVKQDAEGVLDKTFTEIWNAYAGGRFVVVFDDTNEGEECGNTVIFMGRADLMLETSGDSTFYAETADDYPVFYKNNR